MQERNYEISKDKWSTLKKGKKADINVVTSRFQDEVNLSQWAH